MPLLFQQHGCLHAAICLCLVFFYAVKEPKTLYRPSPPNGGAGYASRLQAIARLIGQSPISTGGGTSGFGGYSAPLSIPPRPTDLSSSRLGSPSLRLAGAAPAFPLEAATAFPQLGCFLALGRSTVRCNTLLCLAFCSVAAWLLLCCNMSLFSVLLRGKRTKSA